MKQLSSIITRRDAIGVGVSGLSVAAVLLARLATGADPQDEDARTITVGFLYNGDESTPYAYNFIRAQHAIEAHFDQQVRIEVRSNVPEEAGEEALTELVDAGCDLIVSCSYGYGEAAKRIAQARPEVQIVQATCDNANTEPVVPNYHTFMGAIYQGRYVSGIVAGMKLAELQEQGVLSADQARVGYVAAFPYAEVISGYTAFLLGVRSVVGEATMVVRYTDTWTSYTREQACAEQLVEDGCVIIAQHSDTIGPAVVCENTQLDYPVLSVGYNQSMLDVAPTTSLVSTRISWAPYLLAAVEAVLADERIETHVDATVNGNDACAGFERDWIEMVELNEHVAAKGTAAAIEAAVEGFRRGEIDVFRGPYVGADPFDASDTYDLSQGFVENDGSSAPQFHYVLQDVIEVRQD